MVEVFKTNVSEPAQGQRLVGFLSAAFPSFRINLDLADCDKILRVEGEYMETRTIMMVVKQHGFTCEILD